MISAFLSLAGWLLSLFGFGKRDDAKEERNAGERIGQAEQKVADQDQTIKDQQHVIDTLQKMDSVRTPDDDAAIKQLRDGNA